MKFQILKFNIVGIANIFQLNWFYKIKYFSQQSNLPFRYVKFYEKVYETLLS